MKLDPKEQRKIETKQRRGWILYFLYAWRPKPVSFSSLISLLDSRNMPMTCRRFSEELDYLRSSGFLRVFPLGADSVLSNVDQAKLIQQYCDSDGEMNDNLCAALTTNGVNFQEGDDIESGITRVNY